MRFPESQPRFFVLGLEACPVFAEIRARNSWVCSLLTNRSLAVRLAWRDFAFWRVLETGGGLAEFSVRRRAGREERCGRRLLGLDERLEISASQETHSRAQMRYSYRRNNPNTNRPIPPSKHGKNK